MSLATMTENNTTNQNINICTECKKIVDDIHALKRCKKCYDRFRHKSKLEKYEKVKCLCRPECDVMIPEFDEKGNRRKYAFGHAPIGELSHRYKGRFQTSHGYMYITDPSHPNSNSDGHLFEHRFKMSEYLGRPLKQGEFIHHINGDKKDNRIENLQIVSNKEHYEIHQPRFTVDMVGRICNDCGSDKTYVRKDGNANWYRLGDGFICRKCWDYRRRHPSSI